MNSYEKSLAKITEMETYDDQLKHKYLKQALKEINDLKSKLAEDIKKFNTRQKEEREKFGSLIKTLEIDVHKTK